jgi:4-amino-4-deoxy-L-arabinose transferase-like glycosyltransferase
MHRDSPSLRSVIFLILALSAALTVPWLERPFHTRGEPREALVAQAMLETGDWISPPAYDGAVPSKPPFTHWLMALVGLTRGGLDEFSARLPAALAVIGFGVAFLIFLHRRIGIERALGVSVVLLAASEWFRSASTCRVDTVLAVSMSGGLLALYGWWERKLRGVPWLAIGLISCATLTKGPVGFVLPLGIFGLFAWMHVGFARRQALTLAFRVGALAVPIVAIASGWYLLGYIKRGDPFIEKVLYENFDRFTSSMQDEPHKHSVFYLVGMLLIGLLPWSVCLLSGSSWRGARALFNRVAFADWWRGQPPLYRFAYLASACVLVFFCIPSSKRSVYLLPLYPFVAILVERWGRDCLGAVAKRYAARVIMLAAGVICLAAVVLSFITIGGVRLDWGAFLASLGWVKIVGSVVVAALMFGPGRMALRAAWQRPLERIGLAMIAAVWGVSFFVYDTVAWQLSPKRWLGGDAFKVALAGERPSGYRSFGSEAYGASFYLGEPFSRALPGGVPAGSIVFLEARKLDQFKSEVTGDFTELFRYQSGIESERKAIVVVRTGGL